jgi:hypothetical protein
MTFFNLSFIRFTITALLLASNLTFAVEPLDSNVGNTNNSALSKDLLNLSAKLAANGTDGLVDQAIAGS